MVGHWACVLVSGLSSVAAMRLLLGFLLSVSLLARAGDAASTDTCGQALFFDGRRRMDIAVLGPQTLGGSLAPAGNATIDFWVRFVDPHEPTQTFLSFSAIRPGATVVEDNAFSVYLYPEAGVKVTACNLPMDVVYKPLAMSSGISLGSVAGAMRWAHVAIVVCLDCGVPLRLYVNGTAIDSNNGLAFPYAAQTSDIGGCDVPKIGCPLLGQDADGVCSGFDATQGLSALLDELRVWDSSKNSTEVALLASLSLDASAGPLPSDLRLYYRFDEDDVADGRLYDEVTRSYLGALGKTATDVSSCGAEEQSLTPPRRVSSAAPCAMSQAIALTRTAVLSARELFDSAASSVPARITVPKPRGVNVTLAVQLAPSAGNATLSNGTAVPVGGLLGDCSATSNSCDVYYRATGLSYAGYADYRAWALNATSPFEDSFRCVVQASSDPSLVGSTTTVRVRVLAALDAPSPLAHEAAEIDLESTVLLILGGMANDGTPLSVNVTSLPKYGELHHVTFGDPARPTYAQLAPLSPASYIAKAGTVVANFRGAVVYKSTALPPGRRDSFGYEWVLPAGDSRPFVTPARQVSVFVRRKNHPPTVVSDALSLFAAPNGLWTSVVTLRATDTDSSHSNKLFYRLLTWPLWGTLSTVSGRALTPPTESRQLRFTALGTRVVAFSTQYLDCPASGGSSCASLNWNAVQVLGRPDVYPFYGDSKQAWSPSTSDGAWEYVEVELTDALFVDSVQVYETYNTGATAVLSVASGPPGVRPHESDWRRIWIWDGPSARPNPPVARVFEPPTCPVYEAVRYVRVELASNATSGWNEIDAVTAVGMTSALSGLLEDRVIVYSARPGIHGRSFDSFAFEATDCEDASPSPATVSLAFPNEFVDSVTFDPLNPHHAQVLTLAPFRTFAVAVRPGVANLVTAFGDAYDAAIADWNATVSRAGLSLPLPYIASTIVQCVGCDSSTFVYSEWGGLGGFSSVFAAPMRLHANLTVAVAMQAPAAFHFWVSVGNITYRSLVRVEMQCDSDMYKTHTGTCVYCLEVTRTQIDADRQVYYAGCSAFFECPYASVDTTISSGGVAVVVAIAVVVLSLTLVVSVRTHQKWRKKNSQKESSNAATPGAVSSVATSTFGSDEHSMLPLRRPSASQVAPAPTAIAAAVASVAPLSNAAPLSTAAVSRVDDAVAPPSDDLDVTSLRTSNPNISASRGSLNSQRGPPVSLHQWVRSNGSSASGHGGLSGGSVQAGGGGGGSGRTAWVRPTLVSSDYDSHRWTEDGGEGRASEEWSTADKFELIMIGLNIVNIVASLLSSEYAFKSGHPLSARIHDVFSAFYVKWGAIQRTLFFPILYTLLVCAFVWLSFMSLLFFGVLHRFAEVQNPIVRYGVPFLTYLCGFFGSPLFMPTCGYFLAAFNCITEFEGESFLYSDCTYRCWTREHTGIVVVVGLMLCAYVPFAAYLRPLWPLLQKDLHVRCRRIYVVHATTVQLLLAVSTAFLQGSPIAHTIIFFAVSAFLTVMSVVLQPYRQMRLNVYVVAGYVCSTLAAVVVGVFYGLSRVGSPSVLPAVLALVAGWILVISFAGYYARRYPPLWRRRRNSSSVHDLLRRFNEALGSFSQWRPSVENLAARISVMALSRRDSGGNSGLNSSSHAGHRHRSASVGSAGSNRADTHEVLEGFARAPPLQTIEDEPASSIEEETNVEVFYHDEDEGVDRGGGVSAVE